MHSQILADQGTEAAALFSSLDWHLAQSLVLVTGVRYTDERRDYTGGSTWTYNIPGLISNTFVDTGIDDTNVSWRVGLNWSPTEDMLVYGSVAKSWKSGGFFSGITLAQEQLEPYEPESLLAYEIGFKTQGAVTLSASAFYYDYEGVQTFMRGGAVQLIGNVDDAELYGVDLDLAWMPLSGLTLQVGAGWLESELGSFIGPTGVPIEQGNEMPNAPGSTLNGLVRYELPLGVAGLQLALQADARYTDETFKEATNDPLIAADSYTLYNARLALSPEDLKWELAAWGRNLGDEEYVVNGLNAGAFFLGNRNYNAPRTFGVEFTYTF
jgi:iron complex outermembrane recepter protein